MNWAQIEEQEIKKWTAKEIREKIAKVGSGGRMERRTA